MRDTRTAYTTGLRQLADLLDTNPDLPIPFTGSDDMAPISIHSLGYGDDDPKATLATIARLLPGTVTKEVDSSYYRINGTLSGLHVQATAYRDAVCERVVTGTREVTVPATPATPAQPEHTQTVEDVEWVCGSLLAEATA